MLSRKSRCFQVNLEVKNRLPSVPFQDSYSQAGLASANLNQLFLLLFSVNILILSQLKQQLVSIVSGALVSFPTKDLCMH